MEPPERRCRRSAPGPHADRRPAGSCGLPRPRSAQPRPGGRASRGSSLDPARELGPAVSATRSQARAGRGEVRRGAAPLRRGGSGEVRNAPRPSATPKGAGMRRAARRPPRRRPPAGAPPDRRGSRAEPSLTASGTEVAKAPKCHLLSEYKNGGKDGDALVTNGPLQTFAMCECCAAAFPQAVVRGLAQKFCRPRVRVWESAVIQGRHFFKRILPFPEDEKRPGITEGALLSKQRKNYSRSCFLTASRRLAPNVRPRLYVLVCPPSGRVLLKSSRSNIPSETPFLKESP